MRHNLESQTAITAKLRIRRIKEWLAAEIRAIERPAVRRAVRLVCRNLDEFVEWPKQSMLLWQGCDRIPGSGKPGRFHVYPQKLRKRAKAKHIYLDGRPNGPAIVAFLIAGGRRPTREGSTNGWSIHHLYSGKFPYLGATETTHAPRDGLHFTQSAGLIAVHPIADAMCDEIPAFAWLLRAHAFKKFKYDPDGVFSRARDRYGFARGKKCAVLCRATG